MLTLPVQNGLTMEVRPCKECGQKLSGRRDQKFCSDYCRNTFNNRLNEDSTNYMRRINNILRRNRRILLAMNPSGKRTVDAITLAGCAVILLAGLLLTWDARRSRRRVQARP